MAIIGTCMSVIHPAINAFALMTLGVPAVILLIHEVRRSVIHFKLIYYLYKCFNKMNFNLKLYL